MLAGAISAMVESVGAYPATHDVVVPVFVSKSWADMQDIWLLWHTTWCHLNIPERCLVWRSWEITTRRRGSAARPCRRQVSSPGLLPCRWGYMWMWLLVLAPLADGHL